MTASGYAVTNDEIVDVRTVRVDPVVRPELVVSGARGTHDRSNFLLVQVRTHSGVTGLGEVSATLTWSGEDGDTAAHVVDAVLAPAIIGRPLAPVADLERRMDVALAGNPFTKAGVSTALWDAYAKALDVPLAVALGGPLRTQVPVKCSLSGSGERLERTYAAAAEAGFSAFKLKVGLDPDEDVDRLHATRLLVGRDTFLGLDANGGYSRRDASRAISLFERHGPAFLEQPVTPEDVEGLAMMRGSGLCIIADESVFGMASLMRVLRAQAADVVSLYVGKSGGPGRAVQMAQVAAAFDVEVIIGSNGELGVGALAQTHVACATSALSADIPSDIIGAHYYERDVLSGSSWIDGQQAHLPDAPGLGIHDDDAIWELFDIAS